MNCDKYLELLSARLDGELTESEERELEAHLESCPACRAAGAQLAALRSAFSELEELPAPEEFTRDVMDRVRETNKTVPLFRRPRFKVLAGLAACAVLAVGLYGAVSPSRRDAELMSRGFSQNALEEDGNFSAGGTPRSLPDEYEVTVYDSAAAVEAAPMSDTEILVVDRMPEGGWDLIPPETPVSADGLHVTGELLEQIARMARDQGITSSRTSGTEEAFLHLIVVLDETK